MAALIQVGSFKDLDLRATAAAPIPGGLFHALLETDVSAPTTSAGLLKPLVSPQPRGLAITSLALQPEFQDWLARKLDRTSYVYFLAWCWDLSGQAVVAYPGTATGADKCLIPIKADGTHEVSFIGDGAVLFPPRPVAAGLAVRVQLWESRAATQQAGQTLADFANTVKSSSLNTAVLALASAAAGVAGATVTAIEQAAVTLAGDIGKLLSKEGDRYIDYFEGYFSASEPWQTGAESVSQHLSQITLNRLS